MTSNEVPVIDNFIEYRLKTTWLSLEEVFPRGLSRAVERHELWRQGTILTSALAVGARALIGGGEKKGSIYFSAEPHWKRKSEIIERSFLFGSFFSSPAAQKSKWQQWPPSTKVPLMDYQPKWKIRYVFKRWYSTNESVVLNFSQHPSWGASRAVTWTPFWLACPGLNRDEHRLET